MKSALRIFLVITAMMPILVYGSSRNDVIIDKIQKVVIDPGHGGRHPGCVYKSMLEKDVTLNIALKLGELIEKNFKDVEVVYTRKTDKFVGLIDRSGAANKAGADLFISIHINSSKNTAASGLETYIMGVSKTDENLSVAMKENDAVVYEDDYSTKYEGYTPGDPTSLIVFSLMQSANRDQSMRFAEIIQKHMAHDLPMGDRGVREAEFLVLYKAAMPAVLVEVGYMSNKDDRAFITTAKGQGESARSLFNAFSEYKSRVEGRTSMILLKESSSKTPETKPKSPDAALPDIKSKLTPQQQKEVNEVKKQPEPKVNDVKSDEKKPAPEILNTSVKREIYCVQIATLSAPKKINDSAFKSYRGKVKEQRIPSGAYRYLVGEFDTRAEATEYLKEVRKEFKDAIVVMIDSTAKAEGSNKDQKGDKTTVKPSQTVNKSVDKVMFYVQIATLSKSKSVNDPVFKSYKGKVVEKRVGSGAYRYLVGGSNDYDETARLLIVVRKEFKDAYVVAFEGEEPLNVNEAREKAKR